MRGNYRLLTSNISILKLQFKDSSVDITVCNSYNIYTFHHLIIDSSMQRCFSKNLIREQQNACVIGNVPFIHFTSISVVRCHADFHNLNTQLIIKVSHPQHLRPKSFTGYKNNTNQNSCINMEAYNKQTEGLTSQGDDPYRNI